MKKMKVTKTLFTNKITYAFISVDDGHPVTKQEELALFSGEPISEEKAKKILRSHNSTAVFIGLVSTSATYAVAADKFIAVAEVVNG